MSTSKSMQLDDIELTFRGCQVFPKGDIDRNVRLYKFYRQGLNIFGSSNDSSDLPKPFNIKRRLVPGQYISQENINPSSLWGLYKNTDRSDF